MPFKPVLRNRTIAADASAREVATISVHVYERDRSLLAMPRPEIRIVARFGSEADRGLDIHAVGSQTMVHRKTIRAGQRALAARTHMGATHAVFGTEAATLAGRIVPLDDLWGSRATRQLEDRLFVARSPYRAAGVLERAIAERIVAATRQRVDRRLPLDAATKLSRANVKGVAEELGVSDRHLRRVFHDDVGMSPKAFAKLARFRRALLAACQGSRTNWAAIAADSGYYDQSHLIEEFRAIAGATPRAFLREIGAAGGIRGLLE